MNAAGAPIPVFAEDADRMSPSPDARLAVAAGDAVRQTSDTGGAPPTRLASTASGSAGSRNDEQLVADQLPLRTPAEAAQLLAVPESWMRRKAAARAIPCTFLGKHLLFSPADLAAIIAAAAQPPRTRPTASRIRPGTRSGSRPRSPRSR
jgi:excisionase family DNA binding protein